MERGTSHERIGEFLVKIGAMTPQQRNEILELQKEPPPDCLGRSRWSEATSTTRLSIHSWVAKPEMAHETSVCLG